MPAVAVADERRHRPGPERWWAESWYFDFAASDGKLGGYVRLALYPNQGVAWYWAVLVGRARRLVMVRDHEVDLPRGRDLEVRGEGLWSALNCETPLDHWSVGLEAFAVALDDPDDAYRGERGDRIGLGYDLEWEASGPASSVGNTGYGQPCRVSGEILVADEQLAFDAGGWRSHHWGVEDWWAGPRAWTLGRPEASSRSEVVARAPLLLVAADGRTARLERCLCRLGASTGALSYGWSDHLRTGP